LACRFDQLTSCQLAVLIAWDALACLQPSKSEAVLVLVGYKQLRSFESSAATALKSPFYHSRPEHPLDSVFYPFGNLQ
jgi:hypothetical protein